ncbi:MAG TPA: hypothetical protein VKE92_11600, partial [Anaerolineales bacterium]|nr:hypothetical protein [Anaerolineales bacterium]
MRLRFVWCDGALAFGNAYNKKGHGAILKQMVENGMVKPPPPPIRERDYIGGFFATDDFHGPAYDHIQIEWQNGHPPTTEELRYMIQQELGRTSREASYKRAVESATSEDTEPSGSGVGLLHDPHKELYPNLFRGGDTIPPEVRQTLKDHVLEPLSKEFTDPDKFIYFTIYGSGISYNWDEGGDLDLQLWVDTEKYAQTTNVPMPPDDLLASIRRIVQMVNFPSFNSLGLTDTGDSKEEATGAMLIQYYPKPGTGSKDENLASQPYACYDLETDDWLVKPKPIRPKFYGDNFLLLMPKAKDIALQAEALLGEYHRNVLNFQFWFAMYQRYHKKEYRSEFKEAMENATQEKEGIRNLFDGVFGGRAEAYAPGGQGIFDERDMIQKLLEVWGTFQDLKHFARAPLPWEEQELPKPKSRWRLAGVSDDIIANGGGTFYPDLTPVEYEDGYWVSLAGHNWTIPVDEFDDRAIHNYLDHISLGPDEYFGAWVDGPQVHLDVTKWIPDETEALVFGYENGQQAIWDIAKNKEIRVPTRVTAALQGLPQQALGPHPELQNIAQGYMQNAGLDYNPPQTYAYVDPHRAQRIAEHYDQLQHSPNDPQVRASYNAMINETKAQYDHLVKNGYQFEFYPPGQDPYPSGPREAIQDLRNNKHMYVYPTMAGFGTENESAADHPLLADSGERWNGQPVTHNDIFRAVHDAF